MWHSRTFTKTEIISYPFVCVCVCVCVCVFVWLCAGSFRGSLGLHRLALPIALRGPRYLMFFFSWKHENFPKLFSRQFPLYTICNQKWAHFEMLVQSGLWSNGSYSNPTIFRHFFLSIFDLCPKKWLFRLFTFCSPYLPWAIFEKN